MALPAQVKCLKLAEQSALNLEVIRSIIDEGSTCHDYGKLECLLSSIHNFTVQAQQLARETTGTANLRGYSSSGAPFSFASDEDLLQANEDGDASSLNHPEQSDAGESCSKSADRDADNAESSEDSCDYNANKAGLRRQTAAMERAEPFIFRSW